MKNESAAKIAEELNLDPRDILRSPIAQCIAESALRHGLFASHYEYRYPLPFPVEWLAAHDEIQPAWQQGVFKEEKYQSFRYDSVVASFHPGQSTKWGAHELLHRMIGFYWHPNINLHDLYLAAWLGELLPVCQFYFLEEIDALKCSEHKDLSLAPAGYCHACDFYASERSSRYNQQNLELAKTFFNQQIEAIKRARLEKKFLFAPFMNLDLASDAKTYAELNINRMQTKVFHEYIEAMPKGKQWIDDWDQYLERVKEVASSLWEQKPFQVYKAYKEEWVRLDVLSRLLQLEALCEGSLTEDFSRLKEFCRNGQWEKLFQMYEELEQEYDLIPPNNMWACGYPLAGQSGISEEQILEGLESLLSARDAKTTLSKLMQKPWNDRRYLGDRAQDVVDTAEVKFVLDVMKPQEFYAKTLPVIREGSLEVSPSLRLHTLNINNINDLDISYEPDLVDDTSLYFVRLIHDKEKSVVQVAKYDYKALQDLTTATPEQIEYFRSMGWLIGS